MDELIFKFPAEKLFVDHFIFKYLYTSINIKFQKQFLPFQVIPSSTG